MNAVPVKPNKDFLKLLTEMGIAEQVAEHALICTGNDSVEAAMTFLYDNPEVDYSELSALTNTEQGGESHSCQLNDASYKSSKDEKILMSEAAGDQELVKKRYDDYDEQYKMVFVVNTALNMGIGKVAAQVAHACLGLYNNVLHKNETALDVWLSEGEKKIVLKAVDHVHLKELQQRAESHKLMSYIVQDAGRTQVPAGSCTVLAIFGEISAVDIITGDLSLL